MSELIDACKHVYADAVRRLIAENSGDPKFHEYLDCVDKDGYLVDIKKLSEKFGLTQ
jgi:hypothetical protein